jgi:hypothetical protein
MTRRKFVRVRREYNKRRRQLKRHTARLSTPPRHVTRHWWRPFNETPGRLAP